MSLNVFWMRSSEKLLSKFTDKHKKQWSAGILSKDVFKNFAKLTQKHLCWSPFLIELQGGNLKCQNHPLEMFCKKVIFKNFVNFTGNTCVGVFFLIKLHFWGFATLYKKTPTQILYLNLVKFKNICFEEHLRTTAYKLYLRKYSNTDVSYEFCELFKNTYFAEHLLTAGSETPVRGFSLIKLQTWRPEGL